MKTEKNHDAKASEQEDDRLNWRYQDKAYNESFKKWRREKRNSVGFYYVENPDRLTYQDGLGFINDYPEIHEANAFRKALAMLGTALIYRVLVDIFFLYLLPPIMERAGVNIHVDMFCEQAYGSAAIMRALEIARNILGRIIPAAVLIRHIQIPFSVIFPMKPQNKPMFWFAFPAAVLAAGVCTVMGSFYNYLLSFLGFDVMPRYFANNSGGELIYILAVNVLLIPIISELCVHGVIMQFMRQFGDGTAIFITSLVLVSEEYDITRCFFILLTSMAAGYFIARSGSLVTGIVMRITTMAYFYAVCYIKQFIDLLRSPTVLKIFLLVTLIFGLVSAVIFLYRKSDSFAMTIRMGYMSFGKRIFEIASSVPIVIWFTMIFSITVINIRFR